MYCCSDGGMRKSESTPMIMTGANPGFVRLERVELANHWSIGECAITRRVWLCTLCVDAEQPLGEVLVASTQVHEVRAFPAPSTDECPGSQN